MRQNEFQLCLRKLNVLEHRQKTLYLYETIIRRKRLQNKFVHLKTYSAHGTYLSNDHWNKDENNIKQSNKTKVKRKTTMAALNTTDTASNKFNSTASFEISVLHNLSSFTTSR